MLQVHRGLWERTTVQDTAPSASEWSPRAQEVDVRRELRAFVAPVLLALAPLSVSAQSRATPTPKPVLFVCEHGTVRSLLAKVLFEEYAASVGLNMTAVSRGTQADSVVPPGR